MGKDLNGKELGTGLTQRKDGRYQARFTNRFGKRVDRCDVELYKVKEWLNIARAENTLGENVDCEIILDEWFKTWMQIHKGDNISKNTRRQYKEVYEKHIKPRLGKKKINKITSIEVRRLLNDLKSSGYGFATQNRIRILLTDMFDKAMIDDLVRKNPVKGIKVVRDEEKEPRFLSLEEQKLFFDYSKGTFYDNLFVVAVNSGLRPGELYALTEKDLDFDKKVIKVTKTLVYQKFEGDEKKTFHLGPPKTKTSKREVKMTRQCETALKKQILQSRIIKSKTPKALDKELQGLIFTTRFGTPLNAQIEDDAIRSILDGINFMRDELEQIERFSGHCFRHTFASNFYRNGAKSKEIQKVLGHKNLQFTMDLYVHLFDETITDSMDRLSEDMDRVLEQDDSEMVDKTYDLQIQRAIG